MARGWVFYSSLDPGSRYSPLDSCLPWIHPGTVQCWLCNCTVLCYPPSTFSTASPPNDSPHPQWCTVPRYSTSVARCLLGSTREALNARDVPLHGTVPAWHVTYTLQDTLCAVTNSPPMPCAQGTVHRVCHHHHDVRSGMAERLRR